MSSHRPGQVRFEAWVPTTLDRDFRARVGNRKAWLQQQMEATVAALPPLPTHQHTRERVGDRWVAGTNVGAWRCTTCGADLTLHTDHA